MTELQAGQVAAVQQQIETTLNDSGLLTGGSVGFTCKTLFVDKRSKGCFIIDKYFPDFIFWNIFFLF